MTTPAAFFSSPKHYEPVMKLYYKRPIIINDNIDVANCIANGTMCEFEGIVFKNGVTFNDLSTVEIDGYSVWLACVSQIKALKLRILDGLQTDDEIRYHELEPTMITGQAKFPLPLCDTVDRYTLRVWRGFKMKGFQATTANARTVHKLQGRSIKNLLISLWDYKTENWVYVALSRVREVAGLYLRLSLDKAYCTGMCEELREFMRSFANRAPPPLDEDV